MGKRIVRAKRTLDRLAVLNAPRARVTRDGVTSEVDVGDVVADDLEVDESLLTGESVPVEVGPGDTVGEREVLTGTAAAASVRAVRDSLLLRLSPPCCGARVQLFCEVYCYDYRSAETRFRKCHRSSAPCRLMPATSWPLVSPRTWRSLGAGYR